MSHLNNDNNNIKRIKRDIENFLKSDTQNGFVLSLAGFTRKEISEIYLYASERAKDEHIKCIFLDGR